MTAILYDHNAQIIAIDSRISQGGSIMSDNFKKYKNLDGEIWFFSGCTSDYDSFVRAHRGEKIKGKHLIDCGAFVLINGGVFEYGIDSGEPWTFELCHSSCLGSGGRWALASLDHGKNAKDAIKYAMTRDNCTGGKVVLFDVKKGVEIVK